MPNYSKSLLFSYNWEESVGYKMIMVIILVRWRLPNPWLMSLGLCSKVIKINGSGTENIVIYQKNISSIQCILAIY